MQNALRALFHAFIIINILNISIYFKTQSIFFCSLAFIFQCVCVRVSFCVYNADCLQFCFIIAFYQFSE